jgi:hypothetical protein
MRWFDRSILDDESAAQLHDLLRNGTSGLAIDICVNLGFMLPGEEIGRKFTTERRYLPKSLLLS